MKEQITYLLKNASQGVIDKGMATKIIKSMTTNKKIENEYAIVGIGTKMPKSKNAEEFWEVIANGSDCIREFPKHRKKLAEDYIRFRGIGEEIEFAKGAYLEEIDEFDYNFFNISPAEARLMDPNQRLFLQETWHCLEDAGYSGSALSGKNIGVFLGYGNSTINEYRQMISDTSPEDITLSLAGNIIPIMASRISHILDFHGPAMVIDTACSSGLLAVDLAIMSMENNECEGAIVGSIKLNLLPIIIGDKLGIEAGDWRTKAFDDASDGTGIGEGVGAVFIKPLKKAIADKDNIYAVIKGSASNNDGRAIGITAPNPIAQEDVITRAWKKAGVEAETISYIEAHGTGTNIGDPIEIQGITNAFRNHTDKKQFCGIGSLKTNIGHLDHAAGIGSLIKCTLALQNKKLPPSINFQSPNRKIDFINSPLYINSKLQDWTQTEGSLRCGVSSFGLSGTNVHLVLEEAPVIEDSSEEGTYILTLSAKTKKSLKENIGNMRIFLEETDEDFSNICYTSNFKRPHYKHRVAIVASNSIEASEELMLLTRQDHPEAIACDGLEQDEKLINLAIKYVENGEPSWEGMYANPRTVHLPLYAFEKHKCLITIPKVELGNWNAAQITSTSPKKIISAQGEYPGLPEELVSKVAQAWGEVLGLETIKAEDDLFDLGGDSIFAVKIMSRIREDLQIEIELRDLLANSQFRDFVVSIAGEYDTHKLISQTKQSIPANDDITAYEATPQQRRIFLMHMMNSDSKAYNMPVMLKIEGQLDSNKLEQAFRKLILEQENLRTVFQQEGITIQAKILEEMDFELEKIETKDIIDQDYTVLMDEFVKGFDLTQGPLLRAQMATLDAQSHLLLMDIHHIICDGYSTIIFLKRLMAYYGDLISEPLEIQYSDYAIWFNKRNEEEDYQKQYDFWKNELKDELPRLNLPLNKKRPLIQSFEGARVSQDLSVEASHKLKQLATRHKTTLYNVLLTQVNILLHLYTQQEDIIIGSPVAGRGQRQLEDIIGLFVNTVILRQQVKGEKTIAQIIQQVKSHMFSIYENQDFQFDELVEALDLPRSLNHNPVFDVMFSMQNFGETATAMNDLEMTPCHFESKVAKVDLTFNALEKEDIINLEIEYATSLFERETIDHMLQNLIYLLEQTIADDQTKIDDLGIISLQEKDVINGIKGNPIPYDKELNVVDLIEAQVKKMPDAVALVFDGQSYSYQELNGQANKLAYRLVKQGIKTGDFVAILAERSVEMMVALIATVKVGATYIPIDPSYPLDRVQHMLEDSGTGYILHYGVGDEMLSDQYTLIDLGKLDEIDEPRENLQLSIPAPTPMYMIYTSGSTGLPKGVILTHQNVHNFIVGIIDMIPFNEEEAILSPTTPSFDIFVLESFLALATGQKIVLATQKEVDSPEGLCNLIIDNKVDKFQSTPLRMKLILSAKQAQETLETLKIIMLGGEAFPPELLETLQEYPHLIIYNMYGPTETTVWSTVADITHKKEITVGHPIANTICQIIDHKNRCLPIGAIGELAIGGDGVAVGYHKRDELNEERFFTMPDEPDRLYKTGDLAKWRLDGELEILGRNDSMVKVNGYRVELGEIQSCVREHELVKDAGVVIPKENYMVAYYVSHGQVDGETLRKYLAQKLPTYMIPNQFIELPSLPHTPNGKLDLKSLRVRPLHQQVVTQEIEPPTNEIQNAMVASWQKILEVQEIGIKDDFFELGGNSMKAILFMESMKQYDFDLVINDIFTYSTIAELDHHLKDLKDQSMLSDVIDIGHHMQKGLDQQVEVFNLSIEDQSYVLYCLEDTKKKEALFNLIKKDVRKSAYPHYIITKEQAEILGLKEDIQNIAALDDFEACMNKTNQDETIVLEKIHKAHESFEADVLNGEVEKEYRLAPIQYYFLDAKRYSGTLLHFEELLDIDVFNQAVEAFLLNQDLFRSTLVKRNGILFWQEHELTVNIRIPYIDISYLTKTSQQNLMQQIATQYYFKDYEQIQWVKEGFEIENPELLYRFLLVKITERDYELFLPVNHAIFDAMSGEIVKRNLNDYYKRILKGEKIGKENTLQYAHFSDQMRGGPVGLDDEELVDLFEFQDYQTYTKHLNEQVSKYDTRSSTYIKFEMASDNLDGDKNAWEESFNILKHFVQDYMQVAHLPIMIYYYGRHYLERDYFNTVGEFIDMIPTFIEGNLPVRKMAEKTQKAIALAEQHNVNFSNILENQSQRFRTPESYKFISQTNEMTSIVFNFQGKLEQKEMVLFEDVLYERLMTALNTEESVNIHFMTRYSNEKIQVDINLPFEVEDGSLEEFFKGSVQGIEKYKEVSYEK